MDPRPEDEEHSGLTRDLPCTTCGHGPHHFLGCECGCEGLAPGLDF